MSKKCPKCSSCNIHVTAYPYPTANMATCYDCGCAGEERDFPEQTLFDQITAAPEVLAEKLVYKTYDVIVRTWDTDKDDWGTAEPTWKSVIIEYNFNTREDAIAATVAKLNEVAECNTTK